MLAVSDIKTKPQTKDFDEGYDRTFGADRKPIRGSWVMDPVTKQLVPRGDYRREERAVDAPIMAGRFYEGTTTTHCDEDGKVRVVDLGSRDRHRAYLKETGLAPGTDYSPEWYARKRAGDEAAAKKAGRAAVERAFHDISEGRRK